MYGIPTIRSDLAAPRIKRISDNKNYGDESDAYGLINPSVYSNRGIYEKDFFRGRPQSEVCDKQRVHLREEQVRRGNDNYMG